MRRSPFSPTTRAALFALVLLFALPPKELTAQSTTGTDAGVFLLLPAGAEAVGMGQAVVAVEGGSEGILWNPAAIGAVRKHELAIHYGQTLAGNDAFIAYIIPSKRSGSFAVSVNILDPGTQEVRDAQNQPIGVIFPRDLVFAMTYGISIAKQLSFGATYKIIQFRTDCSGQCSTVGTFVNSSRAGDVGLQFRPDSASPLSLGLAVRNFGGTVKAGSSDTRDELPTQSDAGFRYHIVFLDKVLKDTQVSALGSLVTTRGVGGVSVRMGGDMAYQSYIHLRAGYVLDHRDNASSASLGFGIQSGRFVFDYAQLFGGASADAGQTPKYLSLRYLF